MFILPLHTHTHDWISISKGAHITQRLNKLLARSRIENQFRFESLIICIFYLWWMLSFNDYCIGIPSCFGRISALNVSSTKRRLDVVEYWNRTCTQIRVVRGSVAYQRYYWWKDVQNIILASLENEVWRKILFIKNLNLAISWRQF